MSTLEIGIHIPDTADELLALIDADRGDRILVVVYGTAYGSKRGWFGRKQLRTVAQGEARMSHMPPRHVGDVSTGKAEMPVTEQAQADRFELYWGNEIICDNGTFDSGPAWVRPGDTLVLNLRIYGA